MLKRILTLTILVTLTIIACKKNNGTFDAPAEVVVDDSKTVSTSISGIVVNESNAFVSGATVTAGTQTTITDNYGFFRFNNISISENNAFVKVTKAGYFNGSRSFMASTGRIQPVRIKLLAKQVAGTFSGSGGGNVLLSSGAKLVVPAGGVVDASGAAYSGTVNVAMKWLDPSDNNIAYTMPGDLRGINTGGSERILSTYGMMGVELSGGAGQVLKIASGKKAELSFPIPASLQASAPASIPLWHFDEAKGRWVEEGSATRVGNNYVGQVAHFSFWNCDIPGYFVNLCIHAKKSDGTPLNNVTIRITKASSPAVVTYGQTDSLGNVCGAVPKNEPLILDVLNNCGVSVYTQNIGPYTTSSSLTITANIAAGNVLVLNGIVQNCSNAAISNGYVVVYTSNGFFVSVPVTATGSFSATIINCSNSPLGYTVIPVDYVTQQQGVPVVGSATTGTINLGNISACGTSTAEFLNLTLDGQPYYWSRPGDTLSCYYGGGGTFVGTIITGFTYSVPNMFMNNYSFTFSGNNNTVNAIGTYRIISGSVRLPVFNMTTPQQETIPTQADSVHITEFGPPGVGYIAGYFTAHFPFIPGNVVRTVVANFRHRQPL